MRRTGTFSRFRRLTFTPLRAGQELQPRAEDSSGVVPSQGEGGREGGFGEGGDEGGDCRVGDEGAGVWRRLTPEHCTHAHPGAPPSDGGDTESPGGPHAHSGGGAARFGEEHQRRCFPLVFCLRWLRSRRSRWPTSTARGTLTLPSRSSPAAPATWGSSSRSKPGAPGREGIVAAAAAPGHEG